MHSNSNRACSQLNSVYDRDPKPPGLRPLGYTYSLILSLCQSYRHNKQQMVSLTKDGFLWRNHQKPMYKFTRRENQNSRKQE